MKNKYLPYIRFPVTKLPKILKVIKSNNNQNRDELITNLIHELNCSERIANDTLISLANLKLIKSQNGQIALSDEGMTITKKIKRGSWSEARSGLHSYLLAYSEINDIIQVIKKLAEKGIPAKSRKKDFATISEILMNEFGYARASVGSVDRYITLFRKTRSLVSPIVDLRDFTFKNKIENIDDFTSCVWSAYMSIIKNDPILEKVRWVPISEIENKITKKTNLEKDAFINYLFILKRRNLIYLHATKEMYAHKMNIDTYRYGGYLYSLIQIPEVFKNGKAIPT